MLYSFKDNTAVGAPETECIGQEELIIMLPDGIRNHIHKSKIRVRDMIYRRKNQPVLHGLDGKGSFNGSRCSQCVPDLGFVGRDRDLADSFSKYGFQTLCFR